MTANMKNYRIINYETVDSTMEEAKRLVQSKHYPEDILVVVAEEQLAGRGTHGRSWASPKGAGLYFSVVHQPSEKKKYEVIESNETIISLTTSYTLSAGIACIEALREELQLPVYIKPVNDIYAKSSKLAGILVEYKSIDLNSYLVTGIGLNIKDTKYSIKEAQISLPKAAPISVEELLDQKSFSELNKEKLLKAIIEKIIFWHSKVFNGEEELVKSTWESYTSLKL